MTTLGQLPPHTDPGWAKLLAALARDDLPAGERDAVSGQGVQERQPPLPFQA
jgi:hypothetical protein